MESLKVTGTWKQGIYEISETATEEVGTLRIDKQGRKFRYARAGGTALGVGLQTVSPVPNADWTDVAPSAGAAIGDTYVTLTITDVDTDSLPAGYFVGGSLFVNDGVGEKYWYPINYSSAIAADGTSLTVGLAEPLKVAITVAGSECVPIPSPWMATVLSATVSDATATGVPLVAVTANYYYWSQTGGLGGYWGHTDVAAIGGALILGTDDGSLVPHVFEWTATADTDNLMQVVAHAYGTAGVNDEFRPCIYCLD